MFLKKRATPGLSVIVIFYDMPREAPRTLYSLSKKYQCLDTDVQYEVVAIDNGSTRRLSKDLVCLFGPEFHYHYVETDDPSPCASINTYVSQARFAHVLIMIDGARMLSPGIVRLIFKSMMLVEHPFTYSLGMHLGSQSQNYSVRDGYNTLIEDQLLESVDWKIDGYSLFSISSLALSSKRGFFSQLAESNCFALRRDDFEEIGRYDQRFKSAGGGLCNLELFNRVHSAEWIQPIMLLGEASFHQFHGGVATNVPIEQHPWPVMHEEYTSIVGEPYQGRFRSPLYLGSFREECIDLYNADDQ
jgi:hypothetical protein